MFHCPRSLHVGHRSLGILVELMALNAYYSAIRCEKHMFYGERGGRAEVEGGRGWVGWRMELYRQGAVL